MSTSTAARSSVASGVVCVPGRALIEKDTKTDAERRVAIGTDTLEVIESHRLRPVRDALAVRATLGPDAYVFSQAPDGCSRLAPTR